MKIINNKFYIQFPLNHAPRMRPQRLDKTQKNETSRHNKEDTKKMTNLDKTQT